MSLWVLAGIAASDVICCARLGEYSQGEDHRQAVDLLGQAAPDATQWLLRLTSFKSKAAYTSTPASGSDVVSAERAAAQLVELARRV